MTAIRKYEVCTKLRTYSELSLNCVKALER
jgi:hypothetical protein